MGAPRMASAKGWGAGSRRVPLVLWAWGPLGLIRPWPPASALAPGGISGGKTTLRVVKRGTCPPSSVLQQPQTALRPHPGPPPTASLSVCPHGMGRCLDADFAQGCHATGSSWGGAGEEVFWGWQGGHQPLWRWRRLFSPAPGCRQCPCLPAQRRSSCPAWLLPPWPPAPGTLHPTPCWPAPGQCQA